MVTTETKSSSVATDTDRQKLTPGRKPQRKTPPGREEKEVEGRKSNGTRGVTPGQTKAPSKPYRNGTIRRPGMLRPSQLNATRSGTGPRRVTSDGLPKQPGAYPGKPRWTGSQPDRVTSDSKPLSPTVTGDEQPQGERDSDTSATDETRDPTTPAPHAAEVSGNTTGHPSGKKCHPKLIVGHRHLNGTIKSGVPVIRNMTHATDEEKVNAILRELQKSSADPTDTSSGEPGINLHISVFEVAPGLVPNVDFNKTPLASKTSAENNDNGHISITKLGLPLTSPTASTPSKTSDRGSEAAAKRFPDSSEYAGSGKSSSSESSDSTETSEYYSPSSSASKESLRTETVVTSSESEPGRGEESGTGGSTPLKPSGFPKGKFTRRPGFRPIQNRTRSNLGPPLSPSARRSFPHRVPNSGALNREPQVQPGSGESSPDATTHPKQRPGMTFRTRNDTRPFRPQPQLLPALAHATTSTTANPQPDNPTTPHPDDGENDHPDAKEESSPSGPFSSEEVPAGITEKPKTDRIRFPHGKIPPKRPGFPGGNGGPKSKVKPGVTWRKRNGTIIRPLIVPLASPKTTPSPTSHGTAAPHAKTTASPDGVKPIDETLTAKTETEDVNLINGDTRPYDPKSRVPAVPGMTTVTKGKLKPGVTIRRKNGTVGRLPPGHKPIKRPLGKTERTEATDAPVPAQPTLRSPDTIQGSTTEGQEGEQLSHVGVQKSSSDSVTLIWGAPEDMYKNFVVTRKGPTEGQDSKNPVVEENERVKEREEEAQRGDGEDLAANTDITGSSPKASPNNTFTKVVPGSARSFLFEGLRPHTQYILSVFGTGPGQRSKTHSVTVNTGTYITPLFFFVSLLDIILT